MNPFSRFAFFTLARDTGFVALAGFTLMVAFSFVPALACKIGATVSLIFSIGLLLRVYYLTEERLLRSEVWRALPPEERPAGEGGRRWARTHFETLMLHLAKGAAGTAGLLYCFALVLTLVAGSPQTAFSQGQSFANAANADMVVK
jgi:hypothetical protein